MTLKCRLSPEEPGCPDVFVRPLAPDDTPALAGLITSACGGPDGPAPSAAGLMAELGSRPGRMVEAWVAIDRCAGDRLGLATLVTSTGKAAARQSIAWLIVRPSARRHGIGQALVTKIANTVANRPRREVWVECHSQWHVAMAFWRAMGFEERASAHTDGAQPRSA